MEDENKGMLYVPFDQFFFRTVIKLCQDYAKEFKNVRPGHPEVSRRLANMFMTILDFARNCEDLPDSLRYPPLQSWNMFGAEVSNPVIIHPRLSMRYVMNLMNEIKRQESEKKLTFSDLEKEVLI
jgi:hypothetical protein